jgi:cytochrome c oxidase subunit 1
MAVSAMFVGSIFTAWAIVWGMVPIAVGLILWFWPVRGRATSGPLRARAR